MTDLLTTTEALELLGWSRSSLWRAERAGRITRATTVSGRPLWRSEDVARLLPAPEPDADVAPIPEREAHDRELRAIREELDGLLVDGQALSGARPIRLMTQAMRRQLALRTARGDRVAPGELMELMKLELRVHHLERFEAAQAIAREHYSRSEKKS